MAPTTFQEAEFIYARAIKLELAAQFAHAFELYFEATKAFIRLSQSATVPAFQAQCRANASKALERAEKIKNASKIPGSQIGVIVAPIDPFGADHQAYMLRKSSIVDNVCYPLWNEPVSSPSRPGALYSDPNGQPRLPSSMLPMSSVIKWKRPSRDPCASEELSLTLTPVDIDQNIISDCSVCASIAICVQHNQRFNSRLLYSSVFSGNQPGRYDVRVYLNGDCRRISIDDLLPFDESGRSIGVSSGSKAVAWPALIEKAYMKVMGGYDFPGSNSSVDLRVLTGWIPEHVDLQSTSFERERTWERIQLGFRKGNCVLSVGTDDKTALKIEGVKLLPSHAYAVIDVREVNNERWITLIDSRVPTTSPSLRVEHENGSRASSSRMIHIRWDDICATFEGVYVSWDPGLFRQSAILHEMWKSSNANDKAQASVRHLRLIYECQHSLDGGGHPLDIDKDIWVLLTRHLSHPHRKTEYISLTVSPEDKGEWREIWLKKGNAEVKGPYTTSPNVLVRTKVGRRFPVPSCSPLLASSSHAKVSGALSILASYDGAFDDVSFTINVFCGKDVKVRWDEDAGIGDSIGSRGGDCSETVNGILTTKNAGGNCSHPTFMLNPQWHLRVHDDSTGSNGRSTFTSHGKASPSSWSVGSSTTVGSQVPKSAVVLSAQGPREVPLNVTVVWSSGERITELTQKEVVTSSGAYTYGQARAAADMMPGDYTVILSAFEPQIHLGQFTLRVDGSRQFDLVSIPQEGAGMYQRVSKGEWTEHTAVGGPSHGRYHLNPIYEVQLRSSAQLSARLHLVSPVPTAPLNLSVFPARDGFALNQPLASSGPYSDALSGVHIPTCTLSPGKYWLVPSTFSAGVKMSFRLVVYCSDAGCAVSRR